MRPIRIALCGTSDKLSYGDALASLIIEDALRERLADLALVRYSASARSASSWPYDVRSLDDFEHDLPELTGVLIGNLATLSLSSPSWHSSPTGDINELAGNWLAPALAALTAGLPVCWNSAAIHDIPEWTHPALIFALSLSRYVSARDEHVVAALRKGGFSGESPTVPSVLFDVPHLVAGKTSGAPRPEAIQPLLRAVGASGDYVVIQDHDRIRPLLAYLEGALAERGMTPVLLPLPGIMGEVAADQLQPLSPATLPLPQDPIGIAALIGHCAGIVALDEGMVTTALAYGLPVLLPPDAQAMERTFTADEVVTGHPDDPVPNVFLERLGSFVLCSRARNAASILDVHWNKLAAQFGPLPPNEYVCTPPTSFLAWNRLLTATQQQVHHASAELSAHTPTHDSEAERQLRGDLELAHAQLLEARAQHQLEASMHETWRKAAEQQRTEAEVERQRLLDMKRTFDAAINALTGENAALTDKNAALTSKNAALEDEVDREREMLRLREADFKALEDEIHHLRSSRSWRLTKPLRSAKDAWRTRER